MKPVTDDPSNPYGLDFYAYGNSFVSGGSAAESGQVYVSEDGKHGMHSQEVSISKIRPSPITK